jgi:hypothetical protein
VAIWKTADNMGGRANAGDNGDHGLTNAAIKRWPFSKPNPDDVLSRASLIFGSGYVDCTNVVRSFLKAANAQYYF